MPAAPSARPPRFDRYMSGQSAEDRRHGRLPSLPTQPQLTFITRCSPGRRTRAASLRPHENPPPRADRADLAYRARRHGRPRPRQVALEEGRAARDRAPRRVGLPARAHARRLRARRAHGRRLHRARPGLDQGRRARRPPRERDLGHDGRRRPPRVRLPPHDEDDRRRRADRLVHRGLHAQGAQDAARQGAHPGAAAAQHALQRALRDPHLPGGPRPRGAVRRRGLPGDQAPDLLPRHRAAAREAAGARAEALRRPGVHPVVRGRQPEGARPRDQPAARAAPRRQDRPPGGLGGPHVRRDGHARRA